MCLSDERGCGLQFRHLGEAMFLKLKHGARLVKRRKPLAKGEVRNVVMKARVQTVDDVLDVVIAGDRRTEIVETISHGFHVHAVREHDHVPLDEALKFSIEVDVACVLVGPEQIMNAVQEGVRDVWRGGEEVGGDAIVQPRDNGAIILNLVRIARWISAVNVVTKPVLAKDQERVSPGGEVGVVEIQHDGHP